MDSWKSFGKFIGSRLAFIAPVCVALGVLFPEQVGALKPLVTALFAFMTFQGALGNNFGNLVHAFRHPASMLVTLLISAVAMPVVAYALGSLFFGDDPNLVCGIVLEYSVPVAVVSAMWVSMFGGDVAQALATLLVSTVLSPVTIPLTLHVLLGQSVEVDAAGMMVDMLFQIALPALAGMAVNDLTHGWRRPRAVQVTMTYQTGMRNISAGAVLAAQYFPGEVMFPVIIGTLFQQVLAACFGTFMTWLLAREDDLGQKGRGILSQNVEKR